MEGGRRGEEEEEEGKGRKRGEKITINWEKEELKKENRIGSVLKEMVGSYFLGKVD